MAESDGAGEANDSFWDLMAEIARLQGEMGKDMSNWARVYEQAGQAMQSNADTLALMADLGRRSERFARNGPPAAARQAMQMFTNPLGMFGGAAPGPTTPGSPFARFWEAWSQGLPRGTQE